MDPSSVSGNFVARTFRICQKSGRSNFVDPSSVSDNFVARTFQEVRKVRRHKVVTTKLSEPLDARPSITITGKKPARNQAQESQPETIEIAALIETTQMGAALELRALGSHHTIGIRDQYRWHGGSRM